MELALALTDTQTERLRRIAEYQNSSTYEVVFLALEEYLADKERERQRGVDPRRAERRRELMRGFVGSDPA